MSAIATQASSLSYEDMTLELLLEARRRNAEYVEWLKSERTAADTEIGELDTMIALRMEESGARKFEHAGFRGAFVKKKAGSATLLSPAIARAKLRVLVEAGEIPAHAVDEVFQDVTPETFVKGDLRKFRKIADYGGGAAAIVRAFVQEPIEVERLEIEEIRPMIDVTPKSEAVLA